MNKYKLENFIKLRLLLSIEGIGPGKLYNLISKFQSIDDIFHADYSKISSVEGISKKLASKILKTINKFPEFREDINPELKRLEKIGANICTYWDEDYPEILKSIYFPPIILYYLGEFQESDKYSIAVVGTRKPSNYGKIQTEKFTAEFVENNITVVSGLARGIDSTAHAAAIKNNGRTIAVIGSGLDVIYPPENRQLFKKIIQNGVVISEFDLGTKPDAQNFPRRNRIISGLSLGTLIVETKQTGGALQTAGYALDQNREVFAVPGNLGVPQSEGTNLLIQKGEAKLVLSAEDVLTELELKLKPLVGKNIPKPTINLNLFEEKILNTLDSEPRHIDKIAGLTNSSISDCLVNLLSLEFKGLVKQLPGKVFCRI